MATWSRCFTGLPNERAGSLSAEENSMAIVTILFSRLRAKSLTSLIGGFVATVMFVPINVDIV